MADKNLIGPLNFSELLGVLRTQETLAARRLMAENIFLPESKRLAFRSIQKKLKKFGIKILVLSDCSLDIRNLLNLMSFQRFDHRSGWHGNMGIPTHHQHYLVTKAFDLARQSGYLTQTNYL